MSSAGQALDVGMGQGRNSIYLAAQRWEVTGLDVSETGLQKARQIAAHTGVSIQTVFSSDEDVDFGRNRWDLIAVIYGMEKRSVYRARDALKPGGIVVVEAGQISASSAPFEYESGELLKIFKGFHILKYEEQTALPDWSKNPIRLVRLVAEKPGKR
jgi:2-polyprenyl-3-methyl-5-hydroxy-6-metoxy-1,4-benzoquinol methylase